MNKTKRIVEIIEQVKNNPHNSKTIRLISDFLDLEHELAIENRARVLRIERSQPCCTLSCPENDCITCTENWSLKKAKEELENKDNEKKQ